MNFFSAARTRVETAPARLGRCRPPSSIGSGGNVGLTAAASITVRVPLGIRQRPGRKTVVTPVRADGRNAVPTRADPAPCGQSRAQRAEAQLGSTALRCADHTTLCSAQHRCPRCCRSSAACPSSGPITKTPLGGKPYWPGHRRRGNTSVPRQQGSQGCGAVRRHALPFCPCSAFRQADRFRKRQHQSAIRLVWASTLAA
jgi:hypothetical protein